MPGRVAVRAAFLGSAALAVLAAAPAAQADTSTSRFEAPFFNTGTVHNQGGWTSFGGAGQGCATYDHKVATNSAFTGIPSSFGAQSLRISSAVTSGCFSDQTFSPSLPDDDGIPVNALLVATVWS